MGRPPVIPDLDGHLWLGGGTAPRLSPARLGAAPGKYTSGGAEANQKYRKTFSHFHDTILLKCYYGSMYRACMALSIKFLSKILPLCIFYVQEC
jgi:hypothetical protein